jgi:hypothetical protein
MPARRRAEKFNAWVEGDAPDTLNDARILQAVAVLRSVEAPALRADFAADLREQLMVEADTVLVRSARNLTVPGSLAPTQRRHHRRLAIAASALAVVGATTSVSMAAQSALPGDALYPIKRALENAQTGLASGDAKTAEMLSNATSRLNEATALATRDTPESDAAVADTLGDFTAQANAAADQALASADPEQITQLRDFTAASMHELELLDSMAPAGAHAAVAAAAQLLTNIDQRALILCPTCGGAVVDLPKIFLASASALASRAGDLLAPNAQETQAGTTLPQVKVSEVVSPVQAPTTGSSQAPSAQTSTDDPALIPANQDASTSSLPDTIGDFLNGGQTSTSGGNVLDPLDPITSPLLDAVDQTVDGTVGGLTP